MFFRDENIFGMQIIEKQYNKNIAKNILQLLHGN